MKASFTLMLAVFVLLGIVAFSGIWCQSDCQMYQAVITGCIFSSV